MKCPNCGAPITMEEKYCSYCGAPNTLAQKHQADMEHFQQEFARTRDNVVVNSRRAGSYAGMLAVFFILFAMVVVAGVVCTRTWDIRYARDKARANARTEEYRAAIEEMIADQDYISMRQYEYASGMSDADTMEEYSAIIRYASRLTSVYENLCDTDEFSYRWRGLAENVQYFSDDLISLYEDPRTSYFRDEAVTDDKLAVIEDIRHQAEALLVAYAGFTPEEAAEVKNLSKARVEELLTEHLTAIDKARQDALKAGSGKVSEDAAAVEQFILEGTGGEAA